MLANTINEVRLLNADLKVLGVLLVKYQQRRTLTRVLERVLCGQTQAALGIENNTKEKETKRTWKIKDNLWDDFVVLVASSSITQAEYVNQLIGAAIEANREKIDRYREITGK